MTKHKTVEEFEKAHTKTIDEEKANELTEQLREKFDKYKKSKDRLSIEKLRKYSFEFVRMD